MSPEHIWRGIIIHSSVAIEKFIIGKKFCAITELNSPPILYNNINNNYFLVLKQQMSSRNY